MNVQEHIPLSSFTTFHIGGMAEHFARVVSLDELASALDFARQKKWRTLILGGGSNMLVSDAGFDGVGIKIELKGIALEPQGAQVLLIAAAGEQWDDVVMRTIDEQMWGIENLSGIPGTVGGAIAGSIGAYGQAIAQTVEWVEALDIETKEIRRFSNAQCTFGYRESLFSFAEVPRSGEINLAPPQETSASRYIILRAAFTLAREQKPELSYRDLKTRFGDSSADLRAIRKAILEIRAGKFPDLSKEGTAGSFFKNPIVPLREAKKLKEMYPAMPLFDMPEAEGVKVPLAWLLDNVLHMKGMRIGGARLYEKQPLVIVAEKNCKAEDVLALAVLVKQKVKENFDIEIREEVKIIE